MGESDLKILKLKFPGKWKYLTKNLAFPCEHFNSIDDYQKAIDNLKKKTSSANSKMIILVIKK